MEFNIFDSTTNEAIRVGYISTERGLVEGVSICSANEYAQLNPGTQFVLRTREAVKYLNINEVNQLNPDDLTSNNECGGIKFDNECGPAEVNFYGGGGVGAQGNPVIGEDGAVLAIDLVAGGFGYQYPPIVEVADRCGIGAGAVTRAVLGEVVETEEVYDQEGDLEEYEICDPVDVDFGRRYSANGKDIGNWDPTLYANLSNDPIRNEIEKYQDFLRELKNPWWTTRRQPPLRLTSRNKVTRTKFDVTFKANNGIKSMIGFDDSEGALAADGSNRRFGYSVDYPKAKAAGFSDSDIRYYLENDYKGEIGPVMRQKLNDPKWGPLPRAIGWNDFMNSYAISPVPPSNVKGSDFAGTVFTFEWEENFPYDGEYIFRGLCDNKAELYLDNEKIDDLGGFNQNPTPLTQTITAGVHRIRVDLLNKPIVEKVKPIIPTPPQAPVQPVQKGPTTTATKRVVPGKATVEYIKEGSNYFVKVDGDEGVEVTVDFVYNAAEGTSAAFGGVTFTELTIESEEGPQTQRRKFSSTSNLAENNKDTLKWTCKFKTGKKYKITYKNAGAWIYTDIYRRGYNYIRKNG